MEEVTVPNPVIPVPTQPISQPQPQQPVISVTPQPPQPVVVEQTPPADNKTDKKTGRI